MEIKNVETDSKDFRDKSNEDFIIYRNARIINSRVENVTIGDYAYCKDSELAFKVLLNKNTFVLNSKIGSMTEVGFGTKILYSQIGRFCSISWDISIGGPNHNMKACTTFNFTKNRKQYEDSHCIIGNDVWIGSGAIIFRDIKIGNGAVIGGGSIVTHDVKDYEIVAGVPARHLGWRFEKNIRDRLLKLKWWDWDIQKILCNKDLLESDIDDEIITKLEEVKQCL